MSVDLEICIDSIHSAIAAQAGGAVRVELCDNLIEGGTTPSAGCIKLVREKIDIDLNVIIRPRGGDFHYTDLEFEIMKEDIQIAKELGADGIVIGILNKDGTVDKKRMEELIKIAKQMTVTFHRAFDVTRDPFEALEDIIDLGMERILTSGQESTALEGVDLLQALVERAGKRISIMPGGGINVENIKQIVERTKVWECHLSARETIKSKMEFKRPNISMGGKPERSEYEHRLTSAAMVREVRAQCNK
ncbi:MAG: copper homeostasis protein CutC [Epulopiscium sp.]|nr:copper homeostasis protein CutC [Candidatus Epulonipiscium sp.]